MSALEQLNLELEPQDRLGCDGGVAVVGTGSAAAWGEVGWGVSRERRGLGCTKCSTKRQSGTYTSNLPSGTWLLVDALTLLQILRMDVRAR